MILTAALPSCQIQLVCINFIKMHNQIKVKLTCEASAAALRSLCQTTYNELQVCSASLGSVRDQLYESYTTLVHFQKKIPN